MDKKIKILTLSDHPLSPSGVANQTKYFIEGLLKTGKFSFICLGGAMKHRDYRPIKVDPWGDDWLVFPVDEYGNHDIIRSVLRTHKPDILWFMTDPRFFGWLWEMEDEVRPLVPMVYYHVWDNYPYPVYNEPFYSSNDHIVTISKVTDDIVRNVSPSVPVTYLTHAVDTNVFKPLPTEEILESKKKFFGKRVDPFTDPFLVFWNNRNAIRKMPGTLIFQFRQFLDRVGKNNATLLMHTEVNDMASGQCQDLEAIIHHLGLTNGEIMLSVDKIPPEQLAMVYNMSDVAINIAHSEGMGMMTLEAMACGVPIIVNETGGLQQQLGDETTGETGIGLPPVTKTVVGNMAVPFIYEDRNSDEQVVNALEKLYNMTEEERQAIGQNGRNFILKNHSLEQYSKKWEDLMLKIYEECGSWDNRKNYKAWRFSKF